VILAVLCLLRRARLRTQTLIIEQAEASAVPVGADDPRRLCVRSADPPTVLAPLAFSRRESASAGGQALTAPNATPQGRCRPLDSGHFGFDGTNRRP
jgi:hypothetical protein